MPSATERYRALCAQQGDRIPLFQQAWWLDAVCGEGKRWEVLLAERKDGGVEGALTYVDGRKMGFRYALLPQLTPWGGPWVDPSLNADDVRRVLTDLVRQLESLHFSLYLQCMSPSLTDWMPFYWASYRQTTRYTYRFSPLRPVEEHLSMADPQRRKRMARLKEELAVDKHVEVEEFIDLHQEYHRRRSGHCTVSPELVRRVCTAALERSQCLIYGVRNLEGKLMGADAVVFDSRCAYSLLSGYDAVAPRNSSTFLFWQLIADLYGRTESFDFEGSMEEGTEPFFRSFGAVQTSYHCIYRTRPRIMQLLLKL